MTWISKKIKSAWFCVLCVTLVLELKVNSSNSTLRQLSCVKADIVGTVLDMTQT